MECEEANQRGSCGGKAAERSNLGAAWHRCVYKALHGIHEVELVLPREPPVRELADERRLPRVHYHKMRLLPGTGPLLRRAGHQRTSAAVLFCADKRTEAAAIYCRQRADLQPSVPVDAGLRQAARRRVSPGRRNKSDFRDPLQEALQELLRALDAALTLETCLSLRDWLAGLRRGEQERRCLSKEPVQTNSQPRAHPRVFDEEGERGRPGAPHFDRRAEHFRRICVN